MDKINADDYIEIRLGGVSDLIEICAGVLEEDDKTDLEHLEELVEEQVATGEQSHKTDRHSHSYDCVITPLGHSAAYRNSSLGAHYLSLPHPHKDGHRNHTQSHRVSPGHSWFTN